MFSGKWCENIVSAVCRDLLAHAMLRCEAAGLPVVLHAHDEIVAEVDDGEALPCLRRLAEIMSTPPSWAAGFPLAVEAWASGRYGKSPPPGAFTVETRNGSVHKQGGSGELPAAWRPPEEKGEPWPTPPGPASSAGTAGAGTPGTTSSGVPAGRTSAVSSAPPASPPPTATATVRPPAIRRPKGGALVQPLKWFGGKGGYQGKVARWILSLMPPRCATPNAPKPDDPGWLHYVEPFFGGGSVLLAQDPAGISEVVNDLSGNLVNFLRVLQDEETFARFRRVVEAVPFAEPLWEEFRDNLANFPEADPVTKAVWFFVVNRQSRGGQMGDFAPLSKTRTRGGYNEQASAWAGTVEGLREVCARLRHVVIFNKPAVEVIRQQDGPRTLFYCDPPYLHDTRVSTDTYEHEMTEADHRELLGAVKRCQAKVLLSAYPSALYDRELSGWNRHELVLKKSASGRREKPDAVEVVWTNF
jgi:DNA adenine methylase